MQPQRDIKANILVQLDNIVMHRFLNKEKSLFTSGILKVAKIDNPNNTTVYFLNLNSFYYSLNKNVTFIKLEYDDTVSYLFPHFDNGLSSITIIKNDTHIHNLEEVLSNAATLTTFGQAMANPELKAKIDEHCPGVDKEPIYGADKIKSTIKEAGKLLGAGLKTLGAFVAQGVSYVGEYLEKKIQEPEQKTEVPVQTKQKWENLKQGTANIFDVSKDFYNKYLSTYVDAGLNYGKQVAAKIQTSDNPTVKYAKELATTSGQAISTAFQGLSEGAKEVGTQLGTHSRKIVNKKYGDDYVKTFLPQGQQQKEQQKKQETTGTQTPLKEQESQTQPLYPHLDQKQESPNPNNPSQ